jgi:H+/Cl- antiporter ClcA
LAWNVAKGATLGTLTGAIIVFVNFVLISWGTTRRIDFQEMLWYFVGGVIFGFILGLFYMTIRAALREIKRQREQPQITSRSTVDSDRTLAPQATQQ